MPFYRIEMGFSPEVIEFYAKKQKNKNYYRGIISFLNFLSNAKLWHHI